MPITGAHMLLYSSKPEELRAVLRDVLGFRQVDAGGGWLIFALPPAELGVHPADRPATAGAGMPHQITFMCDDIRATVASLRAKPGVDILEEPQDQEFGLTVTLGLPGGVEVMLYQPRHPTAI